jgi:putative ABC transport system substrate-binding protein
VFPHSCATPSLLSTRSSKGATPADLPVEQPMQCALIITLKTAKVLGLTMPPHILFQVNEVRR